MRIRSVVSSLLVMLIPAVAFAQGWAPRPPSGGGGGGALTSCPNGIGDISTGCYVMSISGAGGTGGVVTLGPTVVLTASAGAGGLSLGSWTGAAALPTGNLSWAGAGSATGSLVAPGAFTLTGGSTSTWGLTAGTLTITGSVGINLQKGGSTYEDWGVTTNSTTTLASGISMAGAAGAGGLSLGSMTGASTLPTGNMLWNGAIGKTATFEVNGAGGAQITAGTLLPGTDNGETVGTATTRWSSVDAANSFNLFNASGDTNPVAEIIDSSGTPELLFGAGGASAVDTRLLRIGAHSLTLDNGSAGTADLTIAGLADFGVTSSTAETLAANVGLAGAAGTGGLSLGSMTGASTLPTGGVTWSGASGSNLSFSATGAGTMTLSVASGSVSATYSPATAGNWNPAPTTYNGALDTLAAHHFVAVSTANQPLVSTVQTNVTTIGAVPMAASDKWVVQWTLSDGYGTSGDYEAVSVTWPTGATGRTYLSPVVTASATAAKGGSTTSSGGTLSPQTASGVLGMTITVISTVIGDGTHAGTIQLQAAQAVSGNTVTIGAGSGVAAWAE